MHRIQIGKESARNALVYLTDVIRKEIAILLVHHEGHENGHNTVY